MEADQEGFLHEPPGHTGLPCDHEEARREPGAVAAHAPRLSRILDGGFLNSTTSVAVPKGKPEALSYVTTFIEEAKAAGLVRKAFDEMGLKSSQVAPAGMKS